MSIADSDSVPEEKEVTREDNLPAPASLVTVPLFFTLPLSSVNKQRQGLILNSR